MKHIINKLSFITVAAVAVSFSLSSIPASAASSIDSQLRQLINQNNLKGDPTIGRSLPSIYSSRAQLGKHLFFSKIISGDQDTACVSCHHPMLGGGDELSLPIGVGAEVQDLLGPGRLHSSSAHGFDGGPTVPRNAPTTFNIGLWDEVLFFDGRVESLGKTPNKNGADGQGIRTPVVPFGTADNRAFNLVQAQSMFPVTSIEEMRADLLEGANLDTLHGALTDRIKANTSWQRAFSRVYRPDANGEVVTRANLFDAIGEYERSQVFVENRWKYYVKGFTSSLSTSQKEGALLFFKSVENGGAGCASCHSGDFFTDEQFHVVGFPQIGRGKGDEKYNNGDFGRFRESTKHRDKYAFRTPTLLNIEYTAPYGHAGSFDTLERAITYHADPQVVVNEYKFGANSYFAKLQPGMQVDNARFNTRQGIAKLTHLISKGKSDFKPRSLSTTEAKQLADFLRSLSDTRTQNRIFMGQWIPYSFEPDYDGTRVRAFDKNGNTL